MTRDTSRIRAVSLAVIVLLSAVAGSVAFAGSAAAVSNASDVTSITPSSVSENTQQSYSFNYSFTGVNTSGETTLSFSVPGEFDIDSHSVEMQNASGEELNTTVLAGNELQVTATPSTTRPRPENRGVTTQR